MGVSRPTTQDRVWLRVAAEPQLAGDGSVVHVLCTLEDISAQRGAETALQLSDFSVRQASLATLWVAPDARLRRVNRAACELLGYTETELLALTFTDLDADASADRWSDHWRELRDLRRMSFEARHRHKSGRLIAVDVELNWFEFEGQQYNVAFLRDLSATRTLEAQLRHSQKLEAIGTLAGGIAHDFNNILAAIYGFTTLAQHAAADNPEVVDYLAEIRRSGQRAAELVQQILAFSSPRSETTTMGPLRLDAVVADALKLLRASAPTTIEIVAPPDRPAFPLVQGNASQLHQVVLNLATNAVHALGPAPGRLTISLDVYSAAAVLAATVPGLQAGPCVRLTVTDTGAGMDAATQARVFEPFFTTKAPGEGTGLGLSVVEGIVRRHRGGIRLTSAPGRGTTCEVFLPLAHAEAPPPPLAAVDVPRGQGERILLVDDEALIAYAGRIILTQFGYVAESDTSSLAALARLERDPQAFDLVVSDQTMPHLTGLGLAQRPPARPAGAADERPLPKSHPGRAPGGGGAGNSGETLHHGNPRPRHPPSSPPQIRPRHLTRRLLREDDQRLGRAGRLRRGPAGDPVVFAVGWPGRPPRCVAAHRTGGPPPARIRARRGPHQTPPVAPPPTRRSRAGPTLPHRFSSGV
jgi:PAS domain S-box-containing protein